MINFTLSSLKSLGEDAGTHFFGCPMFPKKLAKTKFLKEEMFLGQINLAEIREYDTENLLPDRDGMLYLIFDVFSREYTVFFTQDEPTVYIEGFNKKLDNFRYDNALALALSNPVDQDEIDENCNKMLAPVPESVAKELKDADEYVCLVKLVPQIMEDLGRPFLLRLKECSALVIKKKDLKKGKFSKAKTINV